MTGVPAGYWSVVLQDVRIGSESMLRSSASAILDTGTSMVVGPFGDVGFIANAIDAYCIAFSGVSSSSVSEVRISIPYACPPLRSSIALGPRRVESCGQLARVL